LFYEHKLSGVALSPGSAAVLVEYLGGWLLSGIEVMCVIPTLIKTLGFVFDYVFPLCTDEFWSALIAAVVGFAIPKCSDLLFRFAKADFGRYATLMRGVLSEAQAPDLLMEVLHEDLFSGVAERETQQMVLFEKNIEIVARTFAYLRQFT
jgi:hypothetical protein